MSATASFIARVNDALINPLIALIFVAALLYFLWGLFMFISSTSVTNDKGVTSTRAEGKQHMLWGIIGMVIMVSVFAILRIGLNTFGVTNQDLPSQLPLKL